MNKESLSKELKNARDQLCQTVGRNLLLYQHLELLLKELVGKSQVSVTLEQSGVMESDLSSQADSQTLGGISTLFFEHYVQELFNDDSHDNDEDKDAPDKLFFTLKFYTQLGDEDREKWIQRLRTLTKERNHLVHHSLQTMELSTIEGCHSEIEKLMEQRSRIEKELSILKAFLKGRADFKKKLKDAFELWSE